MQEHVENLARLAHPILRPSCQSVDDGPEKRAGALYSVLGKDLLTGDLLYFLDTSHKITHFREYDGPLSVRNGGPLPEGTRIACCGDDWGMTVAPTARCRIGVA